MVDSDDHPPFSPLSGNLKRPSLKSKFLAMVVILGLRPVGLLPSDHVGVALPPRLDATGLGEPR